MINLCNIRFHSSRFYISSSLLQLHICPLSAASWTIFLPGFLLQLVFHFSEGNKVQEGGKLGRGLQQAEQRALGREQHLHTFKGTLSGYLSRVWVKIYGIISDWYLQRSMINLYKHIRYKSLFCKAIILGLKAKNTTQKCLRSENIMHEF